MKSFDLWCPYGKWSDSGQKVIKSPLFNMNISKLSALWCPPPQIQLVPLFIFFSPLPFEHSESATAYCIASGTQWWKCRTDWLNANHPISLKHEYGTHRSIVGPWSVDKVLSNQKISVCSTASMTACNHYLSPALNSAAPCSSVLLY